MSPVWDHVPGARKEEERFWVVKPLLCRAWGKKRVSCKGDTGSGKNRLGGFWGGGEEGKGAHEKRPVTERGEKKIGAENESQKKKKSRWSKGALQRGQRRAVRENGEPLKSGHRREKEEVKNSN